MVTILPRSNTQILLRSTVLLVVPIAALLITPIATFAAPATPPSPPPAQYLYSSTARDRLNHTFNGLAIGPELV
jgi:hypothetical protein